jgi:hypothetical protein
MTKAKIAARAFATLLLLLALVAGFRAFRRDAHPAPAKSPMASTSTSPAARPLPAAEAQGFLYGRITTVGGDSYEGRLRWGKGDQEAFWGDYFNGSKRKNPWVAYVAPEKLPQESRPIEFLGIPIAHKQGPSEVRRLFMVRFGDIARVEARGRGVRVALRSGTTVDLDRLEASDFDDGVRVWDAKRGVVDLDSLRIRGIELLPTPPLTDAPHRLHGTVRTRQGDFTGFLQWDRELCVGSDELRGYTSDGKVGLRFDTLRSIERRSRDSSVVTLLDGREIVLSGTRSVDHDNQGIYVDDPRYGRVLISWDAFVRADFSPGAGSGPA